MYKISYTEKVKEDLTALKRDEPQSFKKVIKLFDELVEHPTSCLVIAEAKTFPIMW